MNITQMLNIMHLQWKNNSHAADDELLNCSQQNFNFNLFVFERSLRYNVCVVNFEHFKRIDIIVPNSLTFNENEMVVVICVLHVVKCLAVATLSSCKTTAPSLRV